MLVEGKPESESVSRAEIIWMHMIWRARQAARRKRNCSAEHFRAECPYTVRTGLDHDDFLPGLPGFRIDRD